MPPIVTKILQYFEQWAIQEAAERIQEGYHSLVKVCNIIKEVLPLLVEKITSFLQQ